MFLSTVNLPPLILLHALGLTALGLKLTFTRPAKPSADDQATLGLASFGLGLTYLGIAYMPYEENQLLFASVPVRVILAATAAVKLAVDRWQGRKSQSELWGVILYDGVGGSLLGLWLGSFGGKVPAYQT